MGPTVRRGTATFPEIRGASGAPRTSASAVARPVSRQGAVTLADGNVLRLNGPGGETGNGDLPGDPGRLQRATDVGFRGRHARERPRGRDALRHLGQINLTLNSKISIDGGERMSDLPRQPDRPILPPGCEGSNGEQVLMEPARRL